MKTLLIAVMVMVATFAVAASCTKCVWSAKDQVYCPNNYCGGGCGCTDPDTTSCVSCGTCAMGHCILPCFIKTNAQLEASKAENWVSDANVTTDVGVHSKGAARILAIYLNAIKTGTALGSLQNSRGEARIPGDPNIDNNWVAWTAQYSPTTGQRVFTLSHQLNEDAGGPDILAIDSSSWTLFHTSDGSIEHDSTDHKIVVVGSGQITAR